VKWLPPIRRLSLLLVFSVSCVHAQTAPPADPATALAAALTAACRQDVGAFAGYLTAPNAVAFRSLPAMQQTALLKRFVLLEEPGKPLLSTSSDGHTVMRCESGGITSEMRFGATSPSENLAFIPVEVPQAPPESRAIRFGLVRESGSWKLLSVGLLLLDVQAMQQQWQEDDLAARESQAVAEMRKIADALKSYQSSYGALPETLASLGPPARTGDAAADKTGISPEHADLLDDQLAAGETPDYHFRYNIVPPTGVGDDESDRNKTAGFVLAASPVMYGKTGRLSFYLDAGGALHGADHQGAVATYADPRISDP
jgi:hypothetical protein